MRLEYKDGVCKNINDELLKDPVMKNGKNGRL